MVLGSSLEVGKLIHGCLDDFKGLLDLCLSNHQGRSKADDVLVGGLGLDITLDTAKISGTSNWVRTRRPFSFINMQRSQAE